MYWIWDANPGFKGVSGKAEGGDREQLEGAPSPRPSSGSPDHVNVGNVM